MPAIMTKEAYEKYFGILNQGTTLLLSNVNLFILRYYFIFIINIINI